ncbi:MAG TPA: amino acid adenylation domain-containing protein [Longimicrobium sp.]|nr:amino acid adenylation domain-containing protein [Longimicrobium sp.]
MTPSAAVSPGSAFAVPERERVPEAGFAARRTELPFTLGAHLDGAAPAVAALAVLLSRTRGEDGVELGLRTPGGAAVLRLDLSANPSARDLAAQVAEALAGLGTARDGEGASPRVPLWAAEAGEGGAGIGLRVDGAEPFVGALLLDAERFGPREALHLLARFQVVREAMAAAAQRGVLELPLLTPGERAERIRWNATETDLPHGVCLHEAFEAHADAHPSAAAVLCGDDALTYGELEARANRLANHLRRRGVGPEHRVGICVERGPRVLEAILGILKAGGAYVPLDPTYPAERLAHMVATAGVRVLVADEGAGARLAEGMDAVLLDRDGDAIAAESAARPEGGATPENLAYVIFTSGSTGQPKGIALRHRGVMNNLADLNVAHGIGPADRVLLLSSLSFDMSVYETLGILAAGGAVVIPRPNELREPSAWAALCRRHGVTLWNSAPALLGMLCDHAEDRPAAAPSGLRLAFLGGDWVPVPLVDRVRAWAPGMRDFIVMGGATEASIHSIIFPVRAVDPAWRSIPYGVPMANQRAYVLDPHLREVPVGVPGELFLGGIGLARGYTGRAGFTAERFLPHPHGEAGARLYRTGDRARYFADGTIELLGRIDHQVKIRGLRIEPGEVEAALRRHPSVARAVVTARADGGEQRLVAYHLLADGAQAPAARELRDLLRATLPDYMVPAAYVVLDRLPLSPNGKVDRKQLPAPPAEDGRAPYVAPCTPAETALAAIWAEVLGMDGVGADDDFFALGGQSLLATRVVSRVRAELGVELSVRALFEAPTVAELAARLAPAASASAVEPAPIPPADRGAPLPLSFAQERLWFLDRLQPDSAFYNIATALRISGPLDADALERALGEIVRRHEALRTRFPQVAGAPVQDVAPFDGFVLPILDLTATPDDAREGETRRRAEAEASRPFDLAAGPPFRVALLRVRNGEHLLVLTMHHVVGDGWSTGVLLRELAALYGAFRDGLGSPLAAPAVRYADYAAWQRTRLRGEGVERQLAYWRERLAGAPELLALPADHPRPAVQTYRGGRARLELSAELAARLRALAREGASLYMVLLGAFQVLLARSGAGPDVVVGSPVSGRTHRDTEEVVGFFANTLVLRTDLSGDPDFGTVLRRVRAAALGALEHQDVPFERLVEALRPGRSLGYSPLVQVLFALQENDRAPALPGLRVEEVEVDLGTARTDLVLQVVPRGGALRCEAEFSLDLFEPATVQRMLRRLERVLEQVAEDAGTRISRIALLDEAERRQVIDAWNRTVVDYPRDRSIAALFAERAAAAPDALAVVAGGESVTYGVLDARASRLARHLARHGVAAETRVGICLERGVETIVALLAVLKAGGAYVPLDPAYPPERLGWMLADSGAAVLVTRDALRHALPADVGVAVVSLDGAGEAIAAESGAPFDAGAPANGLAYVMYTSGSTGTPKGVGVEHRAAVRLVRGARYVRLGPDEVMLQAAPVSFDASTLEIWGPLLNGGRMVVVPQAAPTLEELGGAITRHGVTTLWLTAGLFQLMVEERLEDLSGVRQLLAGGDVLPAEAVRTVLERFAGCRVINGYGPTENTTFTCCHAVPAGWSGASVPIGTPISGTRVYVLDTAGEPVPVGVPGELYAGGDGVARGYLGRPAATAERFVPDPFSPAPGARMYRTGDRVRWSAPGGESPVVEFLGRLDGQVKIRGFRIEPAEVEAALRRAAGGAECAVVAREDVPGEKRLVAYLAGGVDVEALRAALRAALPEYMVPAAFVAVDTIPLTPNGKVDRAALPAPEPGADGPAASPRTPVEEVLAGIWAEVLHRGRVGVSDNFFDLGGHSLLATRVLSRVREALDAELSVRALFEAPTVAELAARVEAVRRAALPVLPPVVPVDHAGPLPLSSAQERLWFLHRLQPESSVYNVPAALRLGGTLDAGALERALGELVRRHAALRTTFRETEGGAAQVVAPFAGFALPVEDLSALDAVGREAMVVRRTAEDAARPFDLLAGPLFRASLLRLGAEEHVLLLCMHHVVCDEWSMGVLFPELAALYGAFRDGAPSPLPEPAVQYPDYAAWERAQLRGGVLDAQLAYWTRALAGAPALLELPADHPRPAVQTFRGARERFALPGGLLVRLEALARAEGASLYMVMLGAFQALLARSTGSDDVVVGSPMAGRTRRELEDVVGFFVNTLVLRTDLSGDPPFREVLRRVRTVTLGAYEHQDVPFERVVEALQPGRSLSHAPLFQVMFVQENAGRAGRDLDGLQLRRLDVEGSDTSKFDLTLFVEPHGDGIRGSLEYGTDLFDRPTIQRMAGHLARVLEQVADDPDLPLSALDLLGEAERRTVVEAWNRTDADYPADASIHGLFEAEAARTPDAAAVVHGDESVTYGALNARANRIAHHLRRLGVGAESRVGICLSRGPEMVAALLGVLKAGGAYVPLDPAYPVERLAFTLRDAGVAVMVTQESLRGLLPVPHGVPLLSLDGARAQIEAEPAENPPGAADPRGLAYLIYTSGSTGVPKGVAIEHRNAVVLLAWAAGVFTPDELSGVLAATSICFDLSVFELFLPLSRGGRVIVVENALALAHAPARDEVRLINTVPSAIAALLKNGAIPSTVTTVNLAGEPLRAELVDALYATGGIRRVYDLYGPSEDTTYSTWTLRRAGGPETIGRPISNTRAYVLDAGLRPVPAGVVGELYLGGAGLARGYLGRPGLTADRFGPDPLGKRPGGRLYRTGDRARWLADGTLEFLGRLDGQVKVRGYRIELGEVEAVLRRHPDVRACVVVAREHAPGDRRLVAYAAGQVDADALRAHLRQSLPEHMVPSAVVVLDALPLTPNGKLDRKALPAPDLIGGETRYEAPRTPVEETLAGIWADVLRVGRVGVRDGFFASGGHSLLGMRVISRIRAVLGAELPLRALFEAPTVAELAQRVEEVRRAGRDPLPPVLPVARTGDLPLSFAQERLWFLSRMEPESPFYNIPAALRLRGALDAPALQRALGEVVRRHEALRTTFRERDGGAVQVVAPFAGFALPVTDLAGMDAGAREAEAERRAAEDAARPFDLAAGPLVRASLQRLAEEDHVLLLCVHHVAADEWSLGVFFRELAAAYAAFRDGTAPALPEPAVQYADFAVWQRAQLRGEVLDRQLAWWTDRLAGTPALLELPLDRPRPAVQSHRGAQERIRLPAALAGRLEALGRAEGATPYMVLLAAFQVLLGRGAGSDDVAVGSPVAGRTRHEVEALVGFFVNTLVLRTDLSGDPAFRDVLRRVRETTLGAWEHQDLPFERLVEALQPERSLGHAPLFQVMFVYEGAEGPDEALPGLEARRLEPRAGTSKFDLMLALAPRADGLHATLEYATDLFDRGTAVRMLGHLERLLEQVADDADLPLSRLDLLAPAERALVTNGWNATGARVSGVLAHGLFEAQVERTPHAPAVVHDGETVSYRALNERANRLAHHLVGLGVRPDAPVGICLERGVETLVAVLAVLKAGGACVPLDPAYPAERLAYMAASAALPVLVTQDALRASLPPLPGVRVVAVDADGAEIGCGRAENPVGGAVSENLAYVLYTSGSTGTPKGVGMPHGALANLVEWHRAGDTGPGPRRTLQFASLSFDVSFQEIAATLAWGGTLVLVDDALRRDPDRLLLHLARHGVERLFLPFVALQSLAEAARGGAPALALREVVTAGEQLAATPQIAAFLDGIPGCRLINHYGPTETHVATAHTLPAASAAWSPLPPVGAPVANTRTYVLDAGLRPAPVGVPGELYVGGAQVARGYLGRPGLTAGRFVPDPFAGGGWRMYRTGDRARWLARGELEYLGRADQQVKIRGYRVEPGEVESVLRQHPAVADCAVVAREDAPGERRLVAYVTGTADPAELRAHLRGSLPEYMVPGAFMALEGLPLTPSGKLDRRALPAPAQGGAGEDYEAPRTPEQEALAGIWAELLRVERVGVHDNFFELGGHSLLATRVVSRVRQELGVDLPLRALFEAPTVEGLAGLVSARAAAAMADAAVFPGIGAADSPQSLLATLDGLSDEELDRLLAGDS